MTVLQLHSAQKELRNWTLSACAVIAQNACAVFATVLLAALVNNILASLTIMYKSTENCTYVNFIAYNPLLKSLHSAGKMITFSSASLGKQF
jgi:hypothetical protein